MKVERKENILDRKKTHEQERPKIINVTLYLEIVKFGLVTKAETGKSNTATIQRT